MLAKVSLDSDISATLVNGRAPDWVELIPTGPNITGRDGRMWLFDQTAGQIVVSSFTGRAIDLPIDWEHATQHRAPLGQDAPAAGWITALQMRDGALWGKVSWTVRGKAQVEAREYRYLSPVFDFEIESKRVVVLVSAGLTNKPNFLLTALNHELQHRNAKVRATAINVEERQAIQMLGISDADFISARDRDAYPASNTVLSPLETEVAQAMGVSQDDFLRAKSSVR
jgi:phage I-like protein